MESVLSRYRNLVILVGVLFLQVLGLAVQVKRSSDAEHTRLIRIWAVDAITPFERVLVRLQDRGSDLWSNYIYLRGVRSENRELKEQIERLKLDEVRLSENAAQAQRLQTLLGFKQQFITKDGTVPAQVIGSSGSDLSRSIYIDKGSDDGIAQDMAVITANGIVGKVLRVYPSTSLVLMINDQSSGVGALLEKSRLQGVLRGTANGELMLERVMTDEQVAAGDIVLSSGGDQIFPKGLPVGTVTHVSPGHEMFLNIKVKPAADLDRLEEVLVVTQKQDSQPVAQSGGRVRAADILAQRLPSVPDKPPNSTASTAPAQKQTALLNAKTPANSTNAPVNGLANNPANSATKLLSPNAAKPKPNTTSATAAVPSSGSTAVSAGNNSAGSSPASEQPVKIQVLKPLPNEPNTMSGASNSSSGPVRDSNESTAKATAAAPDPAKPATHPAAQQPSENPDPH